MSEDAELLRRYAVEHSEAAFSELIQRHVDLVYSAAVRLVNGDVHRAQDVTQQVFTEFARQARRLMGHPAPVGWLYTTTRLAALRALRTERRRRAREQEAITMKELLRESGPEPAWDELRPVLEHAMHELGEKDRHAVLLRFFQNKSLKEVGMALGLEENAARMRVGRALEKLRAGLVRRGVTTTAAALSVVIAANAVQAAPVGLAATLSTASLAGAAAGTGTTFALLKLMAITKLQAGIGCGLIVASAVTSLLMEQQAGAKMRQMDASVLQQRDRLVQAQARNEQLSALVPLTGGPNNPGDLERLREEVAALRRQTNEMTALQDEEHRLQASLAKIREDLLGPNVDDFEPSEVLAAKEDYCIELSNALRDYAGKHHDRFPTNFDDVTPFLSAKARNETNFSTPQFEIVFQGSMANAFNNKYAHPGHIILFRERKPWKNTDGKWVKFYEMIPGQKWFVTLPDGNFDAWEKQHLVPPEPADE